MEAIVKNLSLLVWLSQLGFSVVVPLVGFIWLGIWLRSQFDWGVWVVVVAVILGLVFAIDGLRYSLRLMDRLAKKESEEYQSISFNDHD